MVRGALFYDRGTVTQRSEEGKPLYLTGIVFDITEEEEDLMKWIKDSEYWQSKAKFDSLTGLCNRSEFIQRLSKLDEEYSTSHSKYSLWMFDIDFFKKINDTYGHLIGDKLLMHLGKLVNENLREGDFAGRYGGDEFIVVFPNTSKLKVIDMVEKFQKELNLIELGIDVNISFSGGIVANDEATGVIDLIELVDKRLYQAKNQGRNQVVAGPID